MEIEVEHQNDEKTSDSEAAFKTLIVESPSKIFENPRKRLAPRFHNAWLHMPEFEGWLSRAKEETHAHCLYCRRDVIARKKDLLMHSVCSKHIKAARNYYASLIFPKDEKETFLGEDEGELNYGTRNDDDILGEVVEVETLNDYYEEGDDSVNKNKRIYKQRFRTAWLNLPVFKDWLREAALTKMAFCLFCHCHVTAGKSELLKHAMSKKHQKNQQAYLDTNQNENQDHLTALLDDTGGTHLLNVIDMRSDSLSQPSREMKKAMVNYDDSNDEDDMPELTKRAAKLLGKETAILLSSHSAANLVAVLAHCQARGSAVIAGKESDVYLLQKEPIVKMGGLCCYCVPNDVDGSFSLKQTEDLLLKMDLSPPFSAVICYECSHLKKGGTVPSLDWIDELSYLSTSYGVGLHCDGTRLLNAALHHNCASSRLVHACQSVTLALDKGLTAPVGALLVGEKSLMARAENIAKYIGVYMSKSQMVVTGCLHALKGMLYKLNLDHESARGIAEVLSPLKSKSVKVDLSQVQTNVIHLITFGCLTAQKLVERLASVTENEGMEFSKKPTVILASAIDERTVALSTHSGISPTDIISIKDKLRYVISDLHDAYAIGDTDC